MIPFRSLLNDMLTPSFEQWYILQFGSISRSGAFRQTFEYQQRADKGRRKDGCIYIQSVPVVGIAAKRIRKHVGGLRLVIDRDGMSD